MSGNAIFDVNGATVYFTGNQCGLRDEPDHEQWNWQRNGHLVCYGNKREFRGSHHGWRDPQIGDCLQRRHFLAYERKQHLLRRLHLPGSLGGRHCGRAPCKRAGWSHGGWRRSHHGTLRHGQHHDGPGSLGQGSFTSARGKQDTRQQCDRQYGAGGGYSAALFRVETLGQRDQRRDSGEDLASVVFRNNVTGGSAGSGAVTVTGPISTGSNATSGLSVIAAGVNSLNVTLANDKSFRTPTPARRRSLGLQPHCGSAGQ